MVVVVAAGGKVNRHAHVLLQQEQQRVKSLLDLQLNYSAADAGLERL